MFDFSTAPDDLLVKVLTSTLQPSPPKRLGMNTKIFIYIKNFLWKSKTPMTKTF